MKSMESANTPRDGDSESISLSETRDCLPQSTELQPNAPNIMEDCFAPISSEPQGEDGDARRTSNQSQVPSIASNGRYTLLTEIARGGMGAVLLGRDGDLNRDLAIKVLLEKYTHDQETVGRFIEEAQIAGQLQHPGIVPIYDLGHFPDNRPFFAMKLVKGRNLSELLKDRKSPEEKLPSFLKIFEQICETMAYAHSKGVIHRDLKPHNVMVGAFGEVQVMDWGLAKVLGSTRAREPSTTTAQLSSVRTKRSGDSSDHTEEGAFLGTASHMPPEQARGDLDAVDERADVFALGSILCQILTGEPAYTGRSTHEIKTKAITADLDDAHHRLRNCGGDRELIAIAMSCLAKVAEDRPRNAGAVRVLITVYLAGVQARLRVAEIARVEALARVKQEKARRILATAIATGLVVIFGISAASWWMLTKVQAARNAEIGRLLAEAKLLIDLSSKAPLGDPSKWSEAEATVALARRLITAHGSSANFDEVTRLSQTVTRGQVLSKRVGVLLGKLSQIRGNGNDVGAVQADADYGAAFREATLDLDKMRPDEVVAALKNRVGDCAPEIASALDDWARTRKRKSINSEGWRHLVEIARAIDKDPNRDELRRLWLTGNESIDAFRELARKADPERWTVQSLDLLGACLLDVGDPNSAAELLLRAQLRYPGDLWLNYDLAMSLQRSRPPRTEEAIEFYRAARAIRPESGHQLAHLLAGRGRATEGLAVFEDLLRLDPDNPDHLHCFGTILRNLGDSRSRAILDRATASYLHVIKIKPWCAEAHLGLGDVQSEIGQQDQAVASYREAIRIKPRLAEAHCNLGLCLMAQGQYREALTALQKGHELGTSRRDWTSPSALWVKQAEALVELEPRLDSLLKGETKPANNRERLLLCQACSAKRLYWAAARFGGEALAEDPKLANDLEAGHRYNAACAAALAGNGQGEDDPKPDATAKAKLRSQALHWLRSELNSWKNIALTAEPGNRERTAKTLSQWKRDSDLRFVRSGQSLANLPEDERKAWQALWTDVDTLLKSVQRGPSVD